MAFGERKSEAHTEFRVRGGLLLADFPGIEYWVCMVRTSVDASFRPRGGVSAETWERDYRKRVYVEELARPQLTEDGEYFGHEGSASFSVFPFRCNMLCLWLATIVLEELT